MIAKITKQTVNKQAKQNTDTTMTKLPVIHIHSKIIRQTVFDNELLAAQADLSARYLKLKYCSTIADNFHAVSFK